jgi:hypothetical protein
VQLYQFKKKTPRSHYAKISRTHSDNHPFYTVEMSILTSFGKAAYPKVSLLEPFLVVF